MAITWTNIDINLSSSSVQFHSSIEQSFFILSFKIRNLKIIFLKLLPHLLGADEF